MRRYGLGFLLLLTVSCATSVPLTTAPTLFTFRSNVWVNLHHFLRVVARGEPAPAQLTPEERAVWDGAVATYAAKYANRDLLRDEGMLAIKETLRRADNDDPLPAIPGEPDLKALLETVAPVYRKHWPATPIPVDLSISAGPVGAYTSWPPHTTLSSADPGYRGLAALEMLFHESSHQWGLRLQNGIRAAAETQRKELPRQLWHAVMFHNAGELTRRALLNDGVVYVEYAANGDLFASLCGAGCRDRIAPHWAAYLDGKSSRGTALERIVAEWP